MLVLPKKYGRIWSDAEKEAARQRVLGKKQPPEIIAKRVATRKGYRHSVKTRQKMALAQKGAKGHNWKGGTTPINNAIRKTIEYRLWREAVFIRDDFTCVNCKVKGSNIHADHIKSFAKFPELRFAIDNGRTLCEPCHKQTDTYGRG